MNFCNGFIRLISFFSKEDFMTVFKDREHLLKHFSGDVYFIFAKDL